MCMFVVTSEGFPGSTQYAVLGFNLWEPASMVSLGLTFGGNDGV